MHAVAFRTMVTRKGRTAGVSLSSNVLLNGCARHSKHVDCSEKLGSRHLSDGL